MKIKIMRFLLVIFLITFTSTIYSQEYFGYEITDSHHSKVFLMHFSSDTRTAAVINHWESFLSEKVNGENFLDFRLLQISRQGEILSIANEQVYVYPKILQSSFSSRYIFKLHNNITKNDHEPISESANRFLLQLYLDFSNYLYQKFLPLHVSQIEKKIKSIQKKQNRHITRLQKLQKKQYAHQKEIERRESLMLQLSQDIVLAEKDILETNDEISKILQKRESMDTKQLNLHVYPKIDPIK